MDGSGLLKPGSGSAKKRGSIRIRITSLLLQNIFANALDPLEATSARRDMVNKQTFNCTAAGCETFFKSQAAAIVPTSLHKYKGLEFVESYDRRFWQLHICSGHNASTFHRFHFLQTKNQKVWEIIRLSPTVLCLSSPLKKRTKVLKTKRFCHKCQFFSFALYFKIKLKMERTRGNTGKL